MVATHRRSQEVLARGPKKLKTAPCVAIEQARTMEMEEHRIPRWEEKGVVEAYMMCHKPIGKVYARAAYHRCQEGLRIRWSTSWQEDELVSGVMRTSESMFELFAWAIEKVPRATERTCIIGRGQV